MADVASRELRNNTRGLLDRVGQGETIVITVDGRPVARLEAVGHRHRWMPRADFVAQVLGHQADPGLTDDLAGLAGESTDDAPLR